MIIKLEKAVVIGDEEREKLEFKHERLNILGFNNTMKLLKYLKTSISVVCSRWEEPFGRTSLEFGKAMAVLLLSPIEVVFQKQ